jgi:hypothetical protein
LDGTKPIREVGNVTEDTDLRFLFGINFNKLQEKEALESIPFQVQLNFTDPEGAMFMCVISHRRRVTNQQEVAEKSSSVNTSVVVLKAIHDSAGLAYKVIMKQPGSTTWSLTKENLTKGVSFNRT